MNITKEEAIQLYNYLKFQYINHEKYPLVHLLMKKLSDYAFGDE